jgi:ABC-type proline/glycine betaine transport system permease subunit
MRQPVRVLFGLALALLFAAATVSAVILTSVTVVDAFRSDGSLETFDAHIRHYSDRLVMDEQGLRIVRVPHALAFHFAGLTLCWVITFSSAIAFRRLQRFAASRTGS